MVILEYDTYSTLDCSCVAPRGRLDPVLIDLKSKTPKSPPETYLQQASKLPKTNVVDSTTLQYCCCCCNIMVDLPLFRFHGVFSRVVCQVQSSIARYPHIEQLNNIQVNLVEFGPENPAQDIEHP